MRIDEQLEEIVKRIVEEADPDQIILFGSRAKGENTKESDFDVFVLRRDIASRKQLERRIYLKLFGTGAPVDIIVETPERFDRLKDNPFLIYSEIAKSGRVIYAK